MKARIGVERMIVSECQGPHWTRGGTRMPAIPTYQKQQEGARKDG